MGGGVMSTHPPLRPSKTTATVQPSGLTLEAYADAKKLPLEELQQLGLKTQDGKVLIPYRLVDGRESNAVRYRTALAGTHQFTWRKGSKPTLYGLEYVADARAHGSMVVVEGESDCHTLWHHGFDAVGLPGAASFQPAWLTHFAEIDTLSIVIEPDAGGKQMLGWIAKQPEAF